MDKKLGVALVLDPPTTPEKKKKSENDPITSPGYSPMEVAGEKSASCSKCDILGINSGKTSSIEVVLVPKSTPEKRKHVDKEREMPYRHLEMNVSGSVLEHLLSNYGNIHQTTSYLILQPPHVSLKEYKKLHLMSQKTEIFPLAMMMIYLWLIVKHWKKKCPK